jgi:hypothetical protein
MEKQKAKEEGHQAVTHRSLIRTVLRRQRPSTKPFSRILLCTPHRAPHSRAAEPMLEEEGRPSIDFYHYINCHWLLTNFLTVVLPLYFATSKRDRPGKVHSECKSQNTADAITARYIPLHFSAISLRLSSRIDDYSSATAVKRFHSNGYTKSAASRFTFHKKVLLQRAADAEV